MSLDEITGKVIVEAMIVAIGISVGTAQLGGGNGDEESEDKKESEPKSESEGKEDGDKKKDA